jgi:hypothetical protein
LQIVNTLIAAISFSTIIIWLGKLAISRTFDAGLEKYKSELVKQVEEYKANLIKLNQEHQVRFTRLHEERALKIKLIYSLVIDVESALINSTTSAQGGEYGSDIKRDQDAIEKIRTLITNFEKEQIFFNENTVTKIQIIIKEAWDIVFTMNKVRRNATEYDRHVYANKKVPEFILSEVQLWTKAESRTQNEFKQLKEDLANEFRELLGIK